MPYYKFKKNDLFYNVLKTHPGIEFAAYNGKVFYNNTPQLSGAFTASVPCVPPGNISLYELNVDRNKDHHLFVPSTLANDGLSPPEGQGNPVTTNESGVKSVIFPFVTTNMYEKLKHIGSTEQQDHYRTGDMMTGSYPLSASIKRYYYPDQHSAVVDYYETYRSGDPPWQTVAPERPVLDPTEDWSATVLDPTGEAKALYSSGAPSQLTDGTPIYTSRPNILALKNTLDYYTSMSDHYAFSSSAEGWRKDLQELNLISVPSIYYGQSIKRGSVDLKFYVRGKLVGRAQDLRKNGELLDMTMAPFSKKSILFGGKTPSGPDQDTGGELSVTIDNSSNNNVHRADVAAPPNTDQRVQGENTITGGAPETFRLPVNPPQARADIIKVQKNSNHYSLSAFTMSLWFHKVSSAPIEIGTLMTLSGKHILQINEENVLTFAPQMGGPGVYAVWNLDEKIKDGQWYHIAVSYYGSNTANNPTIYINGVAKTVGSGLTEVTSPPTTIDVAEYDFYDSTTTIGNNLDETRPFEGWIDEVSLWNDDLSSAEVAEIYNSGKACNLINHSAYSTKLLSWWRLGEKTDIDRDSLERNYPGGLFPNGLSGIFNYGENYIIPDEKAGEVSQGYMCNFEDLTNYPPQYLPLGMKHLKTGITSIAVPSCLTGSFQIDDNYLVAGTVLYNEGFILLTGSWDLDTEIQSDYLNDGSTTLPKWTFFGARIPSGSGDLESDRDHILSLEPNQSTANNPFDEGGNPNDSINDLEDAFFHMSLSGTNYVPTRTMLAHAPKGRLNHSNNLTYVDFNANMYQSTGSTGYFENTRIPITNIVSSSHSNHSASFQKHTYISKVGIYDKNRNLIAIAKMATPVRKREIDNLTFKLKIDF